MSDLHPVSTRPRRPTLLAVLLLLTLAPWAGAAPDEPPLLAGFYDAWLTSVDHLISEPERRAFSDLGSDVERELFIRGFWQARRGPSGEHAALELWQRRFTEARRRFRRLAADRAQAMLLAGSPARVLGFGGCGGPVRRLEIWTYNRWQTAELLGPDAGVESFHLVFYEPSRRQPGTFELWSRGDGPIVLMTNPETGSNTLDALLGAALTRPCVPATIGEMRAVRTALENAWDLAELRRRLAPPSPGPAWLERFAAELGQGRARLPAAPTEITFIGNFSFYTIVRGRVRVPLAQIERNADGLLFDRVAIVGDIWQNQRFVAPFRVVHHVAGTVPEGDTVELDFYRRLRPGTWVLSLRVEDARGLALAREEREIEVPWIHDAAEPPAGFRRGFAGLLRGEVGVLTTFPSVRLQTSADELLAGRVEIAAITTGGPIGRIDFLLDGESAASDTSAPWVAELELGPSPEPRRLTAVAFDPAGRELDRDEIELNIGSPRFLVRLAAPHAFEARAEVEVPLAEELDRVELYIDQERFATLYDPPEGDNGKNPPEGDNGKNPPEGDNGKYPPFVHPMPAAPPGPDSYLRAVAYLESGEEAEDIVMLGTRPAEEIDVELVELYTSVTDDKGRPVLGLGAVDFKVLEDGEEQPLARFDTVENLPIHVTLLMDVSQSMRNRMAIAGKSAQRFFEKVLTPKDQAAVLTFNHDIHLVVPFTHEVSRLRAGASGLRAWGSTRLYDSVVYAVHYFGGREGKRALVILSDGEDVDSDFHFRQVREHALRAGIATYPIGLALYHDETRANLKRLASATGGRFFAIGTASQLGGVYRQIEQDLRSQYLLVYRPPEGAPRSRFRRVEVEVFEDGLEARTIHGYYP